ncbi:hypothetical protein ACO2Q1_02505 [Brevundimonas sp. VNH65]|uniref:hypothetical protein n=1 Tax=Brevundimonas sp. VNH65 TaxID=3400917 RepID=UPI003BFBB916
MTAVSTRLAPLAALAAASVLAAACSTTTPAPTPPAASGAPMPVAGLDWHLTVDEPEAKLAYGIAESDELKLGLTCEKGSGRLEINAMRPAGARDLYLESGGETERFSARAEPSELHEGVFLSAQSRTSHPVFQRFRKVGWLADLQGDRRETYAPHAASAPDIERFFAFCG